MSVPEDLAHICIETDRSSAVSLLDEYFRGHGYRRVVVEGTAHLLHKPNWESPFQPPPPYRCFQVLSDHAGWTTITDELDLLDRGLALWLSQHARVIAVSGYRELREFTYQPLSAGAPLNPSELAPDLAATLVFIISNPDHVTKFSYDELGIAFSATNKRKARMLVGYMLL